MTVLDSSFWARARLGANASRQRRMTHSPEGQRRDGLFARIFRPERPVLSAQAEGLGNGLARRSALKGPFMDRHHRNVNDPFRVEPLYCPQSQGFALGW